jgi:hypothetical protein
VPRSVVSGWSKQRELQEKINCLTPESDVEVLMKFGDPQNFKLCAERGLFAYDWSDVHRTIANSLLFYELMARPMKPLAMATVLKLAPDAQQILPRFSVSFSDTPLVPITVEIEWLHP